MSAQPLSTQHSALSTQHCVCVCVWSFPGCVESSALPILLYITNVCLSSLLVLSVVFGYKCQLPTSPPGELLYYRGPRGSRVPTPLEMYLVITGKGDKLDSFSI